mgnify:CR=1 FL=1
MLDVKLNVISARRLDDVGYGGKFSEWDLEVLQGKFYNGPSAKTWDVICNACKVV